MNPVIERKTAEYKTWKQKASYYSYGLGIDLSSEMIKVATHKRPHLHFQVGDIEHLQLAESFDYVVMVDLVEHLSNLRGTFQNLAQIFVPSTIGISSSANPL